MHIPEANDKCDYEKCECVVSGSDAYALNGHTYCSQQCAEGVGCDHDKCNCRAK